MSAPEALGPDETVEKECWSPNGFRARPSAHIHHSRDFAPPLATARTASGPPPLSSARALFEGQVFLNVAVYFDVAVTTMVWLACPRSDQDMNAYDRFPMVWLEAPIVWVEF
jgi:hypothetical protein